MVCASAGGVGWVRWWSRMCAPRWIVDGVAPGGVGWCVTWWSGWCAPGWSRMVCTWWSRLVCHLGVGWWHG